MSGETLKIGATDLSTTAYITSWEGILLAPPYRGDLIEMDFTAGAMWVEGEAATYTFEVPLVMKALNDPAAAIADMVAIQGFVDGTSHTITRVFTSDTTSITHYCSGVVTNAIPVWDLRDRNRVGLILTIQNLTGLWADTI